MRVGEVRVRGRSQRRNIHLVPERQVERAPRTPPGRALHLVDLENLMGGPHQGPLQIARAVAQYRRVARVLEGDHVVLAVNPALAFNTGRAWPAAQLRVGPGQHGADEALLAAVADRVWVATHYDRVVIGSGDGIFASAAAELRSLGIAVGVVAPECGLARRLRQYASFVRVVRPLSSLQVVA